MEMIVRKLGGEWMFGLQILRWVEVKEAEKI
jgi:hypothetical protein